MRQLNQLTQGQLDACGPVDVIHSMGDEALLPAVLLVVRPLRCAKAVLESIAEQGRRIIVKIMFPGAEGGGGGGGAEMEKEGQVGRL